MEERTNLQQQLEQERKARLQAEMILGQKSLELIESNFQLKELNNRLEELVDTRTKELQQEQDQLNILINEHPMPMILVCVKDYTIISMNEKASTTFDNAHNQIIGKNFMEWAPASPEDDQLNNLNSIGGERYIELNGKKFYFESHFSKLVFRGRETYVVLLQDIAKRRAIIKQYRQKEKEYRDLVENVSDIIYKTNEKGRFTYTNPTATVLTGYTEQEFSGKHFSELIRPDYREKLMSFYQFQKEQNVKSTYTEFPIVTKRGEEIWVGQTVDLSYAENNSVEFISLCRNISDRKKMEKALMMSEEKYKSIIENLELGLLEVDREGQILRAYPQFCQLTGFTEEELIGKVANNVLLKPKARKIMETQISKRKKGESSVYEVELTKKNGDSLWVIISGAPYYNERNELAGTVGIHLDITARKKMEEELLLAKEVAEKSLQSKDIFVANMSHEIRTPLNAIIGMGSLLAGTGLTEKQHRFVNAIRSSSENLMTIVNDLLDFSKLESGKMELEIIPGNLKQIITNAVQLWEVKAEEKGLLFEQHIDPKLFGNYYFDPTKINGVLTNLIHNALKFTPEGSVSLSVQVKKSAQNADNIRFEVRDTGIGIAKDKLEGVFESFVQAESSTTRKYGGTGLGLSIAKSMVEIMGGRLTVDSEVHLGSTFSFELSLEKCFEDTTKEKETIDIRPIAGLSILLVEDNAINRYMAQTILEQWEIRVQSAENGAQAIELLEQHTFDLILMDMQMPVLDGIQTTWVIRNKMKSDIPIIALTANAVKGEEEKCLDAGMNGFVSKPFKQEELLCEMKRILDLHNESKTTMNTTHTHKWVDLTLLISNTNGDMDFMSKMMELVVSESKKRLAEINELLEKNEYEKICKIAHSMKPSIDHVAIEELRNLIREVETSELPETLFVAKTRLLVANVFELLAQLEQLDLEEALVQYPSSH